MRLPNKKLFFDGQVFLVCEDIYEPAEDTFLIAKNLHVKEDDVVLDMGTGYGILGILAAKKAKKVVAVDINPHAVRCAQKKCRIECSG